MWRNGNKDEKRKGNQGDIPDKADRIEGSQDKQTACRRMQDVRLFRERLCKWVQDA